MATKFDINTSIKMRSGYEIPALGFGVYQTPADVTEDIVHHAIKAGYRHVDSAVGYNNEKPSAAGMLAAGIPRSELFFTSKVPPGQVNYEDAKRNVDETLKRIGKLEYIDLYLLHAPYGGRDGRLGAWRALVEAVDAGKIRSIGVSNYGVHHLDELEQWQKEAEAEGNGKGGVLSVNQVELHPWLGRKDIVEWCEKRGVLLQAYSPLARAKKMDDPLLVPLCKKHGKTPAQILVRWSLQKGFNPLPKSVTHKRIEENADVYDFELTAEDMETLETDKYDVVAWDPTKAPLNDRGIEAELGWKGPPKSAD